MFKTIVLNDRLIGMEKIKTTSDVKERILDVSRKLFVENGYAGTSIRDIASASETNVAMVNYYFQSKHNLFEIIFDEALEVMLRKIFSILNSDLDFFALIDKWVSNYYDLLLHYPQIPIFVLNEINHDPENLSKKIRDRKPVAIFTTVSDRINKEIEKGTIRETPVVNLLLSIMSLCVFPFVFGGLVTQVSGQKPKEYYAMVRQHKTYVVDFIIRAIKV